MAIYIIDGEEVVCILSVSKARRNCRRGLKNDHPCGRCDDHVMTHWSLGRIMLRVGHVKMTRENKPDPQPMKSVQSFVGSPYELHRLGHRLIGLKQRVMRHNDADSIRRDAAKPFFEVAELSTADCAVCPVPARINRLDVLMPANATFPI